MTQTLSLDEAIALGLAHNRSVANADLQTDKSAYDEATARSKRLPTFKIEAQASQLLRPVDMTFAQGAFGTLPGVGPVPATDATVTTPARLSAVVDAQASQPLTQLIKLNLNAAKVVADHACMVSRFDWLIPAPMLSHTARRSWTIRPMARSPSTSGPTCTLAVRRMHRSA